jgi:hypothetical protein
MLTKHLLRIALSLPLVAIAATAHAGSTITDRSYWPNEARPAAHSGTGTVQSGPRDAFASSRMTPRSQIVPIANEGGNVWRYQGGPKGR